MALQMKYPVRLSVEDREWLERLTTTGVHSASMIGGRGRCSPWTPLAVRSVPATRSQPGPGSRERPCDCCLLYTSDAADDLLCVDLGGRRIIKKKKNKIKR